MHDLVFLSKTARTVVTAESSIWIKILRGSHVALEWVLYPNQDEAPTIPE